MLGLLTLPLLPAASAGERAVPSQKITLEECLRLALLNNRELQVQRYFPPIARSWVEASRAYYDPLFIADARKESSADSGGFDPSDFSRDAIYSADSEVVRSGVTGFGPGGLSYSLLGSYAHSYGFRNGFNFDSYSLVGGVSVRQPLLRNFWIDQGRATIRINRKNLDLSELGVIHLTSDVVNRVRQAYYELAFAGRNLDVKRQLRDTRRALLTGIQRRIEVGTLTVLDEHLAQAELAKVESDLSLADNTLALAGHELRSLIGDSWTNSGVLRLEAADPLMVIPEAFDLQESWQMGAALRHDLGQFRVEVEKAAIDLKFRRNQLFPSVDFVAGYGRRGASTDQVLPPLNASASFDAAYRQVRDGDAPNDMIGVIFSVPLGRVAERGNYRASKELKAQAEVRLRQFEEQVFREVADAWSTATSSLERVERARRAREMAEAALEAENRKLEGGKSTIFFVLQIQGELAAAQTAELRARTDYNRAVSQLHFAEGSLLDRERIDVRFE